MWCCPSLGVEGSLGSLEGCCQGWPTVRQDVGASWPTRGWRVSEATLVAWRAGQAVWCWKREGRISRRHLFAPSFLRYVGTDVQQQGDGNTSCQGRFTCKHKGACRTYHNAARQLLGLVTRPWKRTLTAARRWLSGAAASVPCWGSGLLH